MPTPSFAYYGCSDEFLFERVREDDKNAFSELYRRYWSFLLEHAYRPLKSRAKAEDIVQEIFISLYQRRHELEPVGSLKAYLYMALKYKVFNEVRAQLVREKYTKGVLRQAEYKVDNHPLFDAKDLARAIEQTVGQLPRKCRHAFLLSRQEDLSYKDISGQLQISVSTVEKHISKALKSVRTNLDLYR